MDFILINNKKYISESFIANCNDYIREKKFLFNNLIFNEDFSNEIDNSKEYDNIPKLYYIDFAKGKKSKEYLEIFKNKYFDKNNNDDDRHYLNSIDALNKNFKKLSIKENNFNNDRFEFKLLIRKKLLSKKLSLKRNNKNY